MMRKAKQRILWLLRRERGQSLLIVVFAITALIGVPFFISLVMSIRGRGA